MNDATPCAGEHHGWNNEAVANDSSAYENVVHSGEVVPGARASGN